MDFEFVEGQMVVHSHRGIGRFGGPTGDPETVYVAFSDNTTEPVEVSRQLVFPLHRLPNMLAAFIRRADGANILSAAEMGERIADFIGYQADVMRHEVTQNAVRALRADVVDYVVAVNSAKTLGASALADMVIAEFHLDTRATS